MVPFRQSLKYWYQTKKRKVGYKNKNYTFYSFLRNTACWMCGIFSKLIQITGLMIYIYHRKMKIEMLYVLNK